LSDIDILGPSDRRCVWSAQEKAALLAEIDAEGCRVRLVARRHQMSESRLYNWRSARKAAAVAMGGTETVEFIPIGLIEGPASGDAATLVPPTPEPAQPPPAADGKAGSVEIALPNGAQVAADRATDRLTDQHGSGQTAGDCGLALRRSGRDSGRQTERATPIEEDPPRLKQTRLSCSATRVAWLSSLEPAW
jgi:transposase